ncbi:MAG: hypothetical protein H7A23_15045 [Leptospiraceae bacterium]|nr:hypothetical protein [Leptospiraceae bacterium]MCP5495868.1 hypothetical protein [Leptospiraceae bacterium]
MTKLLSENKQGVTRVSLGRSVIKKTILFVLIFLSCSTSYQKKIAKTESFYFEQNFDKAVPEIRTLAKDAKDKDRLLYLMEAGVIFHSKGDYTTSMQIFKEAEIISDTIKTSISNQSYAFLLNDTKGFFQGESFERVMIKFYIALNNIMLGNLEDAKRAFRKLNADLKEMKFMEDKYRQNLMARYLDAIISEHLGKYNDARVEYKNIIQLNSSHKSILGDRYVLALKENDTEDINQYQDKQNLVHAYDKDLKKTIYKKGMGEVIIINQAGKAATKESRGRLMNDPMFAVPLRAAIETSLRANTSNLSLPGVLAMLSAAENPIPVYKTRDAQANKAIDIYINGNKTTQTELYNDYSETAIKNFNDNYEKIIAKNVASIATKVVAAAIAASAAGQSVKIKSNNRRGERESGNDLISSIISFLAGLTAGAGVSATIEPDLRCWRLIPSNFQVSRIFLEPGTYNFDFKPANGNKIKIPEEYKQVKVEADKPVFINFRTM